jgi:hypothetical protein
VDFPLCAGGGGCLPADAAVDPAINRITVCADVDLCALCSYGAGALLLRRANEMKSRVRRARSACRLLARAQSSLDWFGVEVSLRQIGVFGIRDLLWAQSCCERPSCFGMPSADVCVHSGESRSARIVGADSLIGRWCGTSTCSWAVEDVFRANDLIRATAVLRKGRTNLKTGCLWSNPSLCRRRSLRWRIPSLQCLAA